MSLTNIVGQHYTRAVAEQARQSSRAQMLLVSMSGDPIQTPPSADRLILELNVNETIVAARCG